MDKDINARIAELEAKIDALEDDLVLMYDSLNRRIGSGARTHQQDNLLGNCRSNNNSEQYR